MRRTPLSTSLSTAPAFAALLGIHVTTMKRLFDTEVLPPGMVQQTAGDHWRVRYSIDDLQRCKATLAIWRVWQRKPRAARQHARRGELLQLAIDLIIFDGTRATPRTAVAEYKATFRAVRLLDANSDTSGVRWRDKLLDQPNEQCAAVFILRVAVVRFRVKWQREPKAKELADALDISTASLYRAPFGKAVLHLAKLERDVLESERHRSQETETSDASNPDCPPDTDLLPDSDAEQSPEDRRNKVKRALPAGVHEIRTRKDDSIGKRVRKQRAKTLEMEWDTDGNGGGMLCVFRAESLALKRLNESIPRGPFEGNAARVLVRKMTRRIRKARNMDWCDPTFGCQCWAAYRKRDDGRFDWWINIPPQPYGVTDSANDARGEILSQMARVKTGSPISNLSEIVAGG